MGIRCTLVNVVQWAALGAIAAGALQAAPAWVLGEAVPSVPGADIELADGERLYVEVVEDQFFAVFIDGERRAKHPVRPRVVLNGEGFTPRHKDFNLLLTPDADGFILTHPRVFPPPHDFWLTLVVPQTDSADPQVVPRQRFRQPRR